MHYPNGIKKNFVNINSHSNRGMNLEADLNDTNEYYRYNDIAIIYKKPTPITINLTLLSLIFWFVFVRRLLWLDYCCQ